MIDLFKKFLLIGFCVSLFYSCKKEGDAPTKITFTYYFGDSTLKPDVKYPFTVNGVNYMFRIDVMKMYVSRIKLNTANTSQTIKDVIMFNYKNGPVATLIDTIPAGTYNGFSFLEGLDTAQNNSSPSSYTFGHPLSTAQSMYWGMLKYRFVVMEGVLYDASGKELNSISYHTGIDLVKAVNSAKTFTANDENPVNIQVKFDLLKVFTATGNTIDPTKETFTHSAPGAEYDLASKVMTNLLAGTSVSF